VLIDAEFRGKTGDGLLRHPSYAGVREDLMQAASASASTPARRASRARPRPSHSAKRT
jgi:hypothetical protein